MEVRRSHVAAAIGLAALALAGCGGYGSSTSSESSESPEQVAQTAVADFLDAAAKRDESSACATLTPDGQNAVTTYSASGKEPANCEQALASLFNPKATKAHKPATDLADQVRSGGKAVTVRINGDKGVVTLSVANQGRSGTTKVSFPVEDVDGRWRISDVHSYLFG